MGVKIQTVELNNKTTHPQREVPDVVLNLPCSVFKFSFSWRSWYGFWHNIKSIPYMFSAAKNRATKGWCASDTWEADTSILCYIVNVLIAFRNRTTSYPDKEFETFEEWIAYIDKIIDLLVYVLTDEDELSAWHDNWEKECCSKPRTVWTAKEEGIYQQYMDEVKIIAQRKKEERRKALAMLSEHMDHLWW